MAIKLMKRYSTSQGNIRERIFIFNLSDEQKLKILIISECIVSGKRIYKPFYRTEYVRKGLDFSFTKRRSEYFPLTLLQIGLK